MATRQDASTGEIIDDGVQKDQTGLLHVKVYSPFNVYFDGDAISISAENDTGPFDILLGHKNFLTLLLPGDLVIRKTGAEDERITIARGMMHVKSNGVVVFLDV